MKFLPPEEEIRAQLRELTSKTRRLRADLQGLIDDKGHSDSAFARHRLRMMEDLRPAVFPKPDQPPSKPSQPATNRPKSSKRRP
jgi:hypothetical protein